MKKIIPFVSIIFFLLVWLFLTWFKIIPLPDPIEVIKSFFSLIFLKESVTNLTLIEHAIASLVRVSIGAVIAFTLAIPLGLLIGWYKIFGAFFETIIELLRPIPPLAWLPISIILFGKAGPIFIVFLCAFFPALLNTAFAAKRVSKNLIDMSKIFKATDKQIILKILIPSSLPSILTGMRIGLGMSWMGIIAAEMIALSAAGLGYFIMVMYQVGHLGEMIAGMIMIGIIGYGMNELLLKLNKYIKHRHDKDS